MTTLTNEAKDRLIRDSYLAATEAARQSGTSVQIALGSAMIEYLKSRTTVTHSDGPLTALQRLWGFPVVQAEDWAGPDHVSIRTVRILKG